MVRNVLLALLCATVVAEDCASLHTYYVQEDTCCGIDAAVNRTCTRGAIELFLGAKGTRYPLKIIGSRAVVASTQVVADLGVGASPGKNDYWRLSDAEKQLALIEFEVNTDGTFSEWPVSQCLTSEPDGIRSMTANDEYAFMVSDDSVLRVHRQTCEKKKLTFAALRKAGHVTMDGTHLYFQAKLADGDLQNALIRVALSLDDPPIISGKAVGASVVTANNADGIALHNDQLIMVTRSTVDAWPKDFAADQASTSYAFAEVATGTQFGQPQVVGDKVEFWLQEYELYRTGGALPRVAGDPLGYIVSFDTTSQAITRTPMYTDVDVHLVESFIHSPDGHVILFGSKGKGIDPSPPEYWHLQLYIAKMDSSGSPVSEVLVPFDETFDTMERYTEPDYYYQGNRFAGCMPHYFTSSSHILVSPNTMGRLLSIDAATLQPVQNTFLFRETVPYLKSFLSTCEDHKLFYQGLSCCDDAQGGTHFCDVPYVPPPEVTLVCTDVSLANTGAWQNQYGYGETCESYLRADVEGGWGSPCEKTVATIQGEWAWMNVDGVQTFQPPAGFTQDSQFKDFCRATCHADTSLEGTGEWYDKFGWGTTCASYHAADIASGAGSPCAKTAAEINVEWGTWGTFEAPKGYTSNSTFGEFCRNTCNTFDMSLANTGAWQNQYGYGETCESYLRADVEGGWGSPCEKTVATIQGEWAWMNVDGVQTFQPPAGFTQDSQFKDFCRATCHADTSLEGTGEWYDKFGWGTTCASYHAADIASGAGSPCAKTAAEINVEWGTWGTFVAPTGYTSDSTFGEFCPETCCTS